MIFFFFGLFVFSEWLVWYLNDVVVLDVIFIMLGVDFDVVVFYVVGYIFGVCFFDIEMIVDMVLLLLYMVFLV